MRQWTFPKIIIFSLLVLSKTNLVHSQAYWNEDSAIAYEELSSAGPKNIDLAKILSDGDLEQVRATYESFLTSKNNKLIDEHQVDVSPGTIGNVPILDIVPKNLEIVDKVLIYVHGGAFVFLSPESSFSSSLPIASSLGVRVIAVNYGLAPEHSYAQMRTNIFTVLEHLNTKYKAPESIGFFADSAGASLAMATIHGALESQFISSKKLWGLALISPWSDLTLSGDSIKVMSELDPILKVENYLDVAAQQGLRGEKLYDPLNSPINLPFTKDFPKTLIQVGSREILLSQSTELARRIDKVGIPIKLEVYDGFWHAFQSTHPELVASREARESIKLFFTSGL